MENSTKRHSEKATGRIADIGIDFLQPQEYFWDKVKKSTPNPQDIKALQIGLIKTLPTKVSQLPDKSQKHSKSSKSKPTFEESLLSSQSNKRLNKKSEDSSNKVKQSKGKDGPQAALQMDSASAEISAAKEKDETEMDLNKCSRSNSITSEIVTSDSNDRGVSTVTIKMKDSVSNFKHKHKRKKDKIKQKSRQTKHFQNKLNDPKLKMSVYVRIWRMSTDFIKKWCEVGASMKRGVVTSMPGHSKVRSKQRLKTKSSRAARERQKVISSSEQSEDSAPPPKQSTRARAPKKRTLSSSSERSKSCQSMPESKNKSRKRRKLSSSSDQSAAPQELHVEPVTNSLSKVKTRHSSGSSAELNADVDSLPSVMLAKTECLQSDGNLKKALVVKQEMQDSSEEKDKLDQKPPKPLVSSDDSSQPPTSFKAIKVKLESGAAQSKKKPAALSKKFVKSSSDSNDDDNSNSKTKVTSGSRPNVMRNSMSKLLVNRKSVKRRGAVMSSSEDSNDILMAKRKRKSPLKAAKVSRTKAPDESKANTCSEVGRSLGRGWRIPLLSKLRKKPVVSCAAISDAPCEVKINEPGEFKFGFLEEEKSNEASVAKFDMPAEVLVEEKVDNEQETECTTTWDARSDNARGEGGGSEDEPESCAGWELDSCNNDDSYTQEDNGKVDDQADEREEECTTTWEMKEDSVREQRSSSRDWEDSRSADELRYRFSKVKESRSSSRDWEHSRSSDEWRHGRRRESPSHSRRKEHTRYYPRGKYGSFSDDRSPYREARSKERWSDRRQDYDRDPHFLASHGWYKVRETYRRSRSRERESWRSMRSRDRESRKSSRSCERESWIGSRSRERESRGREYLQEQRKTYHSRQAPRERIFRDRYRDADFDLVEAYDLVCSAENDSSDRTEENMELNALICEDFFLMKGQSDEDNVEETADAMTCQD